MSNSFNNQVAIVIVNWNTGRLLARCVASLLAASDRELITNIVVVDNASSDNSMAELAASLAKHPHASLVHRIASRTNLGFARGNNAGLHWLQEKYGALPHVLLLNPDTEIHSGALVSLLDILHTQPRAGIVGPRLLNADGTLQPSVRAFPTTAILALTLLKLTRAMRRTRLWRRYMREDFDYEKVQTVDQVMGAAFLIRDRVLQEIGFLDEGYFVWFEEVDYCQTARQRGWQVWYAPAGRITHHGGVSFAQLVGMRRTWPWLASSVRYAKKHFGILSQGVLYTLAPVSLALSLPASILHWQVKRSNAVRLNE